MKKQRAYGKNNIRPDNKEIRAAIYTINKCLQFERHIHIIEHIEYAINTLEQIKDIIGKSNILLTPEQQRIKKSLHEMRAMNYVGYPHDHFGESFEIDQKAFIDILISTLKQTIDHS